MPPALRITDQTNHGGTVIGPGVPNVLIAGKPAAVATDNHICPIPPASGHLTASIFPMGSATVFVCGKPALRITDMCLCGAMGIVGEPTVLIGG
ncbi:PAAR domain-containing protein [Rubrolithibacter danxiaensis]|uniref:PAAR domain-containing protein n=1 Tax=Rubrolithibacter danxiaensis TaxID=3390805 RepID=UPI003BF80F2B